jgi:hypothetical protein
VIGGFNPSEKYWSVGMIIPNIWRNKINVPNHQPEKHVNFTCPKNWQTKRATSEIDRQKGEIPH